MHVVGFQLCLPKLLSGPKRHKKVSDGSKSTVFRCYFEAELHISSGTYTILSK